MRQVCLAAPAYPSSLGTLTCLPACLWGCLLGDGERNPVFHRGRRAEHVEEGHAALSMSGSCWDTGVGGEGAEDKLVGSYLPAGEPSGMHPFLLIPSQG